MEGMDGLWAMVINREDHGGVGAGVAHIDGNRITGGDNGYCWAGVIGLKGGGLSGSINVVRYIQGAKPLFPVRDPNFYMLDFAGGYHPERFWLSVHVPDQPELGKMSVDLLRFTGERFFK